MTMITVTQIRRAIHFLHSVTYDDIIVPKHLVEGIKGYLVEKQKYQLVFINDSVANVEPPAVMEFVVEEAPEGLEGDSTTNVFKSAKVETGLEVQVPLFIKPGERIRIVRKTESISDGHRNFAMKKLL